MRSFERDHQACSCLLQCHKGWEDAQTRFLQEGFGIQNITPVPKKLSLGTTADVLKSANPQGVAEAFKRAAEQGDRPAVKEYLTKIFTTECTTEEKGKEKEPEGLVLVWVRVTNTGHETSRNLQIRDLEIICRVVSTRWRPIVLGLKPTEWPGDIEKVVFMDAFNDPLFKMQKENPKAMNNQLLLLRIMQEDEDYGLLASVGFKSGGMDGGAFMGLPTYILCSKDEPRMRKLAEFSPEAFTLLQIFPPGKDKEWHLAEPDFQNAEPEGTEQPRLGDHLKKILKSREPSKQRHGEGHDKVFMDWLKHPSPRHIVAVVLTVLVCVWVWW